MDQFIAFAAPAQPTITDRDPVAVFFRKIDRQIALAKEAKDGKPSNARVAWFKKDGSGYRLKIGREGLKFGEHQWFKAADLDEVIERLTMARQVIEANDALKTQIATNSKARSERMQGSRKAKKTA
ncbi:hypothetical protein OKC48_04155 [Methylorubrum extorquens]|uniref:hypothetical protein n=1 Tax=Methylorubrum extorquens TaxID=408 RepID=UPI0022388A39|nr:hypothetical protein [Methylorubrum extorquens]UYW27713.1 hypothetical protein OKC48_04155 [Methylorubrum extorquens]